MQLLLKPKWPFVLRGFRRDHRLISPPNFSDGSNVCPADTCFRGGRSAPLPRYRPPCANGLSHLEEGRYVAHRWYEKETQA